MSNKSVFLEQVARLNALILSGLEEVLSQENISKIWDATENISLVLSIEDPSDRSKELELKLTQGIGEYCGLNSGKKSLRAARKKKAHEIFETLGEIHLAVLGNHKSNSDKSAESHGRDLDSELRSTLLASQVDDMRNVYVLGCFEIRKTFLRQQERAIWLSTAILKFWRGEKPPRIAVIGAGVAGVTAYSTLVIGGADAHLFERSDELMPFQRRNENRFIHPNLYDWPKENSTNPQADIPILQWTSGFAKDVIRQIEEGFNDIRNSFIAPEPIFDFKVSDIRRHAGSARSPKFALSGFQKEPHLDFDVVIIAIGFGGERSNSLGVDTIGYWDNDEIHIPNKFDSGNKGSVLVSGCGDGALVDTLRASLRDFNHSKIIDLIPELHLPEIKQGLIDIETKAISEDITLESEGYIFSPDYSDILKNIELNDDLIKEIHPAYVCTFNSTRLGKYKLGSSIINRVLVQVFLNNDVIKFREGRLFSDQVTRTEKNGKGGFDISWQDQTEFYHQVRIRHGVDPSGHFNKNFPRIFDKCGNIQNRLAQLRLDNYGTNDLLDVLANIRTRWK